MNNYKKIILQNGVTLYLFNDKKLKQTFVSYSINYGSSGKWFDFKYDKGHFIMGIKDDTKMQNVWRNTRV